MPQRPRRSDSESNLVQFNATVAKPPGTQPSTDPALCALNGPAVAAMRGICERYDMDPDGHAFWQPPTPDQARDSLRGWLQSLGYSIRTLGLHQAATAAIFPVPPGVDHHACETIFVRKDLPARTDLLHVLFALNLGDGAITGAALLHHRADNPTARTVRDAASPYHGDKSETSGTRKKVEV